MPAKVNVVKFYLKFSENILYLRADIKARSFSFCLILHKFSNSMRECKQILGQIEI